MAKIFVSGRQIVGESHRYGIILSFERQGVCLIFHINYI